VFTVVSLWIVGARGPARAGHRLSAERSRAALGAWAGELAAALLGEGARGAGRHRARRRRGGVLALVGGAWGSAQSSLGRAGGDA
jgi:hypothetical protein